MSMNMGWAAVNGPPEPEKPGRDCDMCGEFIPEDWMGFTDPLIEVGEFINPENGEHAYGHAPCGLEREWRIA